MDAILRNHRLGNQVVKEKKELADDSTDDEGKDGRYFDLRLKDSDVPKWDGNPDTLLRWVQRCNLIGEDGPKAWRQLGKIVPRVLTGTAQDWYFSLPLDYQRAIRKDWNTMRQAIADFFLTSKWLDKTRTKALRASYRQNGHGREKPSEYFIRKRELLTSVYAFEDSAVISEVMNGAPRSWNTVLDTQRFRTVIDFHSAIVFHEDTLMDLPLNKPDDHRQEYVERRKTFERTETTARTNLVGASPNMPPPLFPKDDHNVSRKATPESKGARPCRHCGSGNHWDNECKHSFKANKFARANLASATSDDARAQEEYDEFYYGLDDAPSADEQGFDQSLRSTGPSAFQVSADSKRGGDTMPALKGTSERKNSQRARIEEVEDDEDESYSGLHPISPSTLLEEIQKPIIPVICRTPLPNERANSESRLSRKARVEEVEDEEDEPFSKLHPLSPFSILEEVEDFIPPAINIREPIAKDIPTYTPCDMWNSDFLPGTEKQTPFTKPVLNHRSRRRLAKEIQACNYRVISSPDTCSNKPLIELRKYMARPPGSTFLGSSATQATATVGSLTINAIVVIADTGSDITLISRKTLNELLDAPKIKQGHQVQLIQVTGTSSISGYVNVNLFFHTEDGPVKLNVDAYVVDDMTTPFILGNDFMDQYSISIIREEGTTHLEFGDSGRRLRVESSTAPSLIDNGGHAFKVKCARVNTTAGSKKAMHRRNQKFRQRTQKKKRDGRVSSTERVVILPKTSKLIKVTTHFPKNCEQLLVERHIKSCGSSEDIYGSADTFIAKDNSALHVANFSDFPVIISEGQVLGTAHNPRTWLDKASKMSKPRREQAEAHAKFIRQLVEVHSTTESPSSNTVRSESKVSSKAHRNATGEDDPDAEDPVEGGPKTAEIKTLLVCGGRVV
ncbi:hypothetical protein DFH08DRAFT_965018 [Mycena albidolilacea]|uniref:Peptidase A2 domain-containing protein n=1 Tax=Mycena albidolilacea TaxID=1033008 RepID=A0AAD6ZRB0_9AGAR|nr:hypothetical protein DFH08DRAFT_965018 [Mycena albidolilacea]